MQRFRAFNQSPIARALPSGSLKEWNAGKPCMAEADEHLQRILGCVPDAWHATILRRFKHTAPPVVAIGKRIEDELNEPPEWAKAWDLLQSLADFDDEFGTAAAWNLSDTDIKDLAKRLAEDVRYADEKAQSKNVPLTARLDDVRRFVRKVGVSEDKPIKDEPAIKRASDPLWWRRRLRTSVARAVEAGSVSLGLVHAGRDMYVSETGLKRRKSQLERNARTLSKTLFRNEAGQVFTLAELAKLGTANPEIRGGELMTRIRGAEEYADIHAHVGMFVTLTLPSRFHPVTKGGRGRVRINPKFVPGTTARDGQAWLRDKWAKVRAKMARQGVKIYGLRVAEPHHDATPHWHMLIWAEDEAGAQAFEQITRSYWLSEDGDERGADQYRVNFKRMTKGGAAGYVAKYIAKSVGHIALSEHMDVVNGDQYSMDFGNTEPGEMKETEQGHRRVDAWASTWGIRQFQTIGMPSVTVWRELRRVSADQLELFQDYGDKNTQKAWRACHRTGDIKADWRLYMEAMGGHARKRGQWHLAPAKRTPEEGEENKYGEAIKPNQGRIVGVQPQRGCMRGHWLVSRRIAWSAVARLPEVEEQAQRAIWDREAGLTPAGLPAAWTGFNNCTARLTGGLKVGITDHDISAWNPDSSRIRPFLEACH